MANGQQALLAVCVCLGACNLLLGNEVGVASGADDASGTPLPDGSAFDAAPPPEQGCEAVHVSPRGDDQNTGCLPNAPKRSISSALDYARSFQLPNVLVCAGEYAEYILIESATSLRGGYDCTTFSRGALDAAALTTTVSAPADNPLARPATVVVQGTVVDRSVTIEGLKIFGANEIGDGGTEKAQDSVALLVQLSAQVTLDHLFVRGGESHQRAIGLQITGTAPLVRHSHFEGGRSTCAGEVGSVGALVEELADDAQAPRFEDNSMRGGPATCKDATVNYSSIGLALYAGNYQGESKMVRNSIEGFRGAFDEGLPMARVVGLLSQAANLEFEDGAISAGRFDVLPSDSGETGRIALQDRHPGGHLRILRTRLRGADLNHAAPAAQIGTCDALSTYDRDLVQLHDSVVYAGNVFGAESFTHSYKHGATFGNAAQVEVSHTTVVLGDSGTLAQLGMLFFFDPKLPGTLTAKMDHNLLVAGPSDQGRAMAWSTLVQFASVTGNGFGPFQQLGELYWMQQNAARLADLQGALPRAADATVADNVEVLRGENPEGCDDASSCIQLSCVGCTSRIFQGFDLDAPVTFGERAAAAGPGYPLASAAPCLLTTRPEGALRSDLLGKARAGNTSSAGAHESDDAGCTSADQP